ncbi:MAG TPA: glycosyltransferase family A protein, partial [Gemmataceae bacterium]|nr:glycosyltransferase family A protein [Gemmataceae bacterium]
MSTPDPSISVLMPNYNNGHLIANALESVCTQDYAPIEVLITDDCSTDNSLEVIQRYADRYSFVRIVRYPEKSKDWLRKHYEYWRTARGDYVMSLASDDIIYPGLLRKAAELIRQHPGVGVVFPDIRILFP